MMPEWIDISVPLRTGMASWPGDPPVRIQRVSDMENGDGANLTQINMSAHSGTHMDAPLHFYENGKGIEAVPFSALIGPARVIEITDPEIIRAEVLEEENIQAGERILFKTRNSARYWPGEPFAADFVSLATVAPRGPRGRGPKASRFSDGGAPSGACCSSWDSSWHSNPGTPTSRPSIPPQRPRSTGFFWTLAPVLLPSHRRHGGRVRSPPLT